MKRRTEKWIVLLVILAIIVSYEASFIIINRRNVDLMRQSMTNVLYGTTLEQKEALRAEMAKAQETVRITAVALDKGADVSDMLQSLRNEGEIFSNIEILSRQEEQKIAADGEQTDISFTAPLQDGRVLQALIPRSYFEEFLANRSSEEECYAYVTDSKGNLVFHSDHTGYLDFSENNIQFYNEVIPDEEGDIAETLTNDMSEGKSGNFSYTYGNQKRYVIYTPVGMNDLYLFYVANEALLKGDTKSLHSELVTNMCLLGVLGVVLFLMEVFSMRRAAKEIKKMQEKFEQSEQMRKLVANMSYTILFEADPVSGEIWFNDAYQRQIGESSRITNIHNIVKEVSDSRLTQEEMDAWRNLSQEMHRGLPKSQASVKIPHAGGTPEWYRVVFRTVYSKDKTIPERIIGRMANIEWQEQEQMRALQPEKDALTGLLGHKAFMEQAQQMISQYNGGSLVVLDIDNFKDVRNGDGQYRGDSLILYMGEKIREVFPSSALFGRLSGDTFAILLKPSVSRSAILEYMKRLGQAFGESGSTFSAGIATWERNVVSITDLIKRADNALYKSKLEGKHRSEFYGDFPGISIMQFQRTMPSSPDSMALLNQCAIALLTSDALLVGVDEALTIMAGYYDADRVAILEKDNQNRIVAMYNWNNYSLSPLDISPIPVNENSVIARAFREKRTLTITSVDSTTVASPEELARLRNRGTEAVMIVPLNHNGNYERILSMENPKQHLGNVTFLKQVANCLGSAIAKYRNPRSEE